MKTEKNQSNVLKKNRDVKHEMSFRNLIKLYMAIKNFSVRFNDRATLHLESSRCMSGDVFFSDEFFLIEQLEKTKILFCDEAHPWFYRRITRYLTKQQHIVLFSSHKKAETHHEFDIMHLTSNLRATSQIARFANNWGQDKTADFK